MLTVYIKKGLTPLITNPKPTRFTTWLTNKQKTQVTEGTIHVTLDTWDVQMTCGGGGAHLLSTFQLPSSYGFGGNVF